MQKKSWFSKALIDSSISYEEFVSVNDVFKEYNDVKQAIKNPKIINHVYM